MDAPASCDLTRSIPTPCLVVDAAAFDHNVATMASFHPGAGLRPHVKAFKSTALARALDDAGHHSFTCATSAEAGGLVAAGLGLDVLLANEAVDVERLRLVVERLGPDDRFTVAVDSAATIEAAARAGVADVVIDVNVGLPRCGCDPEDAGVLATSARQAGLRVRGVMGYEGHLMMVIDREARAAQVTAAMQTLAHAADAVAGDDGIISAGGTGTYDLHQVATEIQAGSYTLMDTDYGKLGLPFRQALWIEATIISINRAGGWIVADAGLKAMAIDHGNPSWEHGKVWFCSDEHVTLQPTTLEAWRVGDRVRLAPAHVDPTVAKHQRMWRVGDIDVVEWPVDLRHWDVAGGTVQ